MAHQPLILTYFDKRTKDLYDEGFALEFIEGYCDGFNMEINDRYFYASRQYCNGFNLGMIESAQYQSAENYDIEEGEDT